MAVASAGDRISWESALRDAWQARCGAARNLKLPSAVELSGRDRVRLWLPAAAVTANMQTDAAAFESWLLALKAWCDIPAATLAWETPAECGDGHYQRFLYRVQHFARLFPWVAVEAPERLEALLTRNLGAGPFVLNAADSKPPKRDGTRGEAALERALLRDGRLLSLCRLDVLDQQFPVGLFREPKSKKTAIFTCGKSAIDLVGWNAHDRRLVLFELKAAGNVKAGMVSELFFYAMLLQDLVRRDDFGAKPCDNTRATITPAMAKTAARIEAYLLAGDFHPLLEGGGKLALLNQACHDSGDMVRFGRIVIGDAALTVLDPVP